MYLTERIAVNIGKRSREMLNEDEDKEKVVVYGAIGLLQVVWGITWTSIMSLIFGVFFEAILFSIVISALRKYSGGVHASAPHRCVIIGTFISVGFGILIDKVFIKASTSMMSIVCTACILIALAIVIKKAPVDSPKKLITNPVIKQRFKLSSIILICLYMLCMVVLLKLYMVYGNPIYFKTFMCIGLGAIWQAITLTKNGGIILNKIDAVLKYILEGGD